MEVFNVKKRRKGKKRVKPSKKSRKEESGEVFDLDADGEEEEEITEKDGVMSHQLSFYKGEEKIIVKRATVFIRIFLLNMHAYPDKDVLARWASKAFIAACQLSFGPYYEGELCLRKGAGLGSRTSVILLRSNAQVHEWA